MNRFFSAFLGLFLYVCSSFLGSSTQDEERLINHVTRSIERAEKGKSKLSKEILEIDGMSSPKVRHFMNNLCALPNTTYLEIGCWKGSTWISSLYNNDSSIQYAYAIDNWSQFGNQRDIFMDHCQRFLELKTYKVYSMHSFAMPLNLIKNPITIYFYDGDHSALSQELAFTYYDKCLSPLFIAIVDDWNCQEVKDGTMAAFRKLGYKVLFQRELPARYNGDVEGWWNGLFVAVIKKENSL